jgi:hypothetical protein
LDLIVNFPVLFKLREGAEELLEKDDSPFVLPEKAFVFWMHQGYQFAFFVADGDDDPMVYYYMEGKKTTEVGAS